MKLKGILIALFVLGVCFCLFIFCFYKYSLTAVSNDNTEDIIVTIEAGSIDSIGKILKENDLIRNELVFKVYIRLNKINNLQASTYKFNKSMPLEEIISILEKGNSYNPDEIMITFKEGKNIRQIATTISENTNNSYDDVIAKVNNEEYIDSLINKYWFLTNDIKNTKIFYNLEGYLFPDTYAFSSKDVTIETIIETMLDETKNKLDPYKEKVENYNLSIHELFTLASIVELESASSSDRKGIAGVFYNRVEDNWSIGSDVTTYYAWKADKFEVGSLSSDKLNYCDYAYNTRCNSFTGLPVGPICSPSLESLLASLEPEDHEYYYFVGDCSGKTYFNKTISGHNNTISKLKKENNWCA